MADRLHKAKLMGADVIVDGKTENLKEAGLYICSPYEPPNYKPTTTLKRYYKVVNYTAKF